MKKFALAAVLGVAASLAQADQFKFIALGDLPYGDPENVYGPYEALIGKINDRNPDLVLHIGDTKSGGSLCSNPILDDQLGFLNSFDAPLIYTPGDNEWTDCHRENAGGFDPLERLTYIRDTYFADPAKSFGRRQASLTHQGKRGYPENVRLTHKGVAFIAAHVVGSNNNFRDGDKDAVNEFYLRSAATTDWLRESFAAASDAEAIVLSIYADMFEYKFNKEEERWTDRSGFFGFGTALQEVAEAFGKPVLLVFGDSHEYRCFKPFQVKAPNVMALEVFGNRDMNAVEVAVDTAKKDVFIGFTPVLGEQRC